ncbi:molybdopterin converting factor small subunit [Aurantimicrobium minutum]|uniref:DUF349 domain-containing protein n=1 Tax=Aurantimicrobium minutum TaxID=708131 RepID=UPI0024741E33|nr:DUF349 domain-containing protein [Aurantimicrobium minutum]MDH6533007.1 molybdopterin converting factor small subunit [Aurantimicrobium minutum]
MSEKTTARVDEAGHVYVVEATGERLIGQYADVSPEEALAFFERKFNDTNSALVLLEQRAKRGAPAAELAESAGKLKDQIESRNGIGNYDALSDRLTKLVDSLGELTAAEKEKNAAALEEAKAARMVIVEAIEKLATTDPSKIQWKQTTAQVDELFAQWQASQKNGPRLSKSDSNELWKRFRDARQKLDQHRRAFFADLDSKNKGAKSAKEELITKAEALSSQGAGGVVAYRALLDQWKLAPRAGKKIDDALWARFKAAGDALYAAKKTEDEAEDASFAGNLEVKLAILAEAEGLINATDRVDARAKLNALQRKWDAAGKVPRAQLKPTEERMRKVEQAVRKLEDYHWNASNPEKQARSEGLAGQIEEKIEKLQAELTAAQAAKNSAKVTELEAAITTQKEWLAVLK